MSSLRTLRLRSWTSGALVAAALLAACGGEAAEQADESQAAQRAAEQAARAELSELELSAGEAFDVRMGATRIRDAALPRGFDPQAPDAQVKVTADAEAVVTPRDADDGRRLAFPAAGRLRVPVVVDVALVRDMQGRWGATEATAEPALPALGPGEADGAADAAAEAVTRLLTFDGDRRAHAARSAADWAVRAPTSDLPASDLMMPPPALGLKGATDAVESGPDAGPRFLNNPDHEDDDVPLTALLGDERSASDGCELRLRSLRPGTPTVRVEDKADGLLQAVVASGRLRVRTGSMEGCQEEGGFFDEPGEVYDRGSVDAVVHYAAVVVRPRWVRDSRWYMAGAWIGREPTSGVYDPGGAVGDAGPVVQGMLTSVVGS